MARIRRVLSAARARLRGPQKVAPAPSAPLEARLRQVLRPYAKGKLWNKCFCIGAHKTGTTTLGRVLELLGYDVAPQQEVEMACVRQVQYGQYGELASMVERHDAFQDSPFSQGHAYIALDALFPGSRFILTYRDPQEWFASLTSFHAGLIGKPVHMLNREDVARFSYIRNGYTLENREYYWLNRYGHDYSVETDWDLHYDKDHYISTYIRRNQEIARYFKKRPDDLLVVDLTRLSDIAAISSFLGLPTWVRFSLPHLNATDQSRDRPAVEPLSPELVELLRSD